MSLTNEAFQLDGTGRMTPINAGASGQSVSLLGALEPSTGESGPQAATLIQGLDPTTGRAATFMVQDGNFYLRVESTWMLLSSGVNQMIQSPTGNTYVRCGTMLFTINPDNAEQCVFNVTALYQAQPGAVVYRQIGNQIQSDSSGWHNLSCGVANVATFSLGNDGNVTITLTNGENYRTSVGAMGNALSQWAQVFLLPNRPANLSSSWVQVPNALPISPSTILGWFTSRLAAGTFSQTPAIVRAILAWCFDEVPGFNPRNSGAGGVTIYQTQTGEFSLTSSAHAQSTSITIDSVAIASPGIYLLHTTAQKVFELSNNNLQLLAVGVTSVMSGQATTVDGITIRSPSWQAFTNDRGLVIPASWLTQYPGCDWENLTGVACGQLFDNGQVYTNLTVLLLNNQLTFVTQSGQTIQLAGLSGQTIYAYAEPAQGGSLAFKTAEGQVIQLSASIRNADLTPTYITSAISPADQIVPLPLAHWGSLA